MTEETAPAIDITRVIGSGCFGVVLEATYRNSNKKCALKRVQKCGNQISREIQILEKIKDLDNVVHMEHIFYTRDQSQTKLVQNIVFEFVESNLQSLIEQTLKAKSTIDQKTIKKYIYQLLNGLSNIHQFGIAHRDLKPENVLLSQDGVIKICDFGSSKIISVDGKNTPYIVSRYYRAPQLILCLTKYSTSIDIWATGCILAQLYLLYPMFRGKTQGQQMIQIAKKLGGFMPTQKDYYKDKVPYDVSLLDNFDCYCQENLKNTFSMSKDKLNLIDLLQSMLAYNPNERITAAQAKKHPYFDEIRDEIMTNSKKSGQNDISNISYAKRQENGKQTVAESKSKK